MKRICEDIENFKKESDVDEVIVLWTANTERFSDVIEGVNDTAQNLKNAIANGHAEISPSTLFAYASIMQGVRVIFCFKIFPLDIFPFNVVVFVCK